MTETASPGRRRLFLAALAGGGGLAATATTAIPASATVKPKATLGPAEFTDVIVDGTLTINPSLDQWGGPILTAGQFVVNQVTHMNGASLGDNPPVFTFDRTGTTLIGPSAGPLGPSGDDTAGTGDAYTVTSVGPSNAVVAIQTQGFTYDPSTANGGIPVHGGAALIAKGVNTAIAASTTTASSTMDTVTVAQTGLGRAVLATTSNAKNTLAPLTVRNAGTGPGVYAANSNVASGAAAIQGTSAGGYGGIFTGKKAAVNLAAGGAAHPASGGKGDLYVTSGGALWFCHGGTSWKQLA